MHSKGTYASGTAACTWCVAGKYNDAIGQTSETGCKDDCGAGSYITSDKSTCSLCEKGQWQDQISQPSCKICGSGKYNNAIGKTSETNCTNCEAGTYFDPTLSGQISVDYCKTCESNCIF